MAKVMLIPQVQWVHAMAINICMIYFYNFKTQYSIGRQGPVDYICVEGTDWDSSFGVNFISNTIDHLPLYQIRAYDFGSVFHICVEGTD